MSGACSADGDDCGGMLIVVGFIYLHLKRLRRGRVILDLRDWVEGVNKFKGMQDVDRADPRAIEVYTKAVETLVELASLQVCYFLSLIDVRLHL